MPSLLDNYHAQRQRLEALEDKYARKIRVALIRSAAPAVEMLAAGAGPELAAARVSTKEIIRVLEQLYTACLPEAALTYDSLTEGQKALAPPALVTQWGQRLKSFISKEGAESIKRITDTTRKVIKDVLTQSAAAGDGIKVAAKKLRDRIAALAPERARRIARTELVSGSNYASLMGAQATGLRLEKAWLATPDGRTRQSHIAANGQGAPLQDGFFQVGGYPCRYPGDVLLPASERANCRCAIIFRKPMLT